MPTTRVEDILKNIHVLFAKGKPVEDNPDKIILSKSEMFAQLEKLNEAMYEVLDKYEATTRSRERAKLEVERQASEIVIKAKQDADDVHAASYLYTDDMISEVSTAISDVTDALKRDFDEFLRLMGERQQILQEDRKEIDVQLDKLHDREFYLKTLQQFREEELEDEEYDDEEEDEENDGTGSSDENGNRTITAGMNKPVRKRHKDKNIEPEEEWPEEEKPAAPVIRVNKPGENSGVQMSTKRDRKRKQVETGRQQPGGEKLTPDELKDMTEEQIEALENSTPAYGSGYTAEDFPNLDAEYEQFKEEQGQTDESEPAPKKGFLGLFGKKNKYK